MCEPTNSLDEIRKVIREAETRIEKELNALSVLLGRPLECSVDSERGNSIDKGEFSIARVDIRIFL